MSATPGSGAERRVPEWVGPDVQAPPGARFRARVTAARPGRCGCRWGRRIPRAAPGSFGPTTAPTVLRKPLPAEKRPQKLFRPEGRRAAGRSQASQGAAAGCSRSASSTRPAESAGGAGNRSHACAACHRAPRGPREASSRARGWGRGGRAVDSRESARRGDSSLRDFRIVEGRGGSSPGRRDTEGF